MAPFKSQNMALNSFVTRDGLEMGRAQVVQAQAAGIEPDTRMNPILLKPTTDVGSQVIVNGEVRGQMPASAYFRMKRSLIPEILSAYNSLAGDVDIIVIEGAGSPAEINLKADDIVNMGLAKLVDAPVLLAGDIDRGGVFAQLYGTVELLEPDERARIKGLIINKFRGDVEILRPGLAMLEEKTRLPVLGVVPYLKVDIEDEDSLSERLDTGKTVKPLDAAVLRLPHISNFTDFMPLEQHPLLGVRYVQNARQLGTPDCVILPGTKNTVEDLLWLRQSGLEAAVLQLAAAGVPVLGVCGGYQMLGQWLDDTAGTESGRSQTVRGLGLLPTRTVFTGESAGRRSRPGSRPPLCRGAADRLRDPYRPHRSPGHSILPPVRGRSGGLRGGQCLRHLPSRPVRHRRADRSAGRLPLQAEGAGPRRCRSTLHGAVPAAAAGSSGRRRPPNTGSGRHLRRHGHGAKEQTMTPQHHLPADIERTSLSIITAELAELGLTPPPETAAVVLSPRLQVLPEAGSERRMPSVRWCRWRSGWKQAQSPPRRSPAPRRCRAGSRRR